MDEIECIEDYLNEKYNVFETATENPGQCLNNITDLVGWYTGDSLDLTNNEWEDISGANNHGIISGSGIQLFNGIDINNEFYINGRSVVLGTTSTQLLFKPMITPQHTIFNVCKYKSSGTKRVILQAETHDAAFGFRDGLSGIGYEQNGYHYTHNFGNDYIISAQGRDMYHANGIDLAIYSRMHSYSSRLTINQGSWRIIYKSFWMC